MEIIETAIPGLVVIKPRIFADDRGYFFESFNRDDFIRGGVESLFVQDNESLSQKGVLRGLHFQKPPHAQGKLVRVIRGAVRDVAVDIRTRSATFGKWEMIELSGDNKQMLWIPPGFAHGFVTLTDDTVFFYKCTQLYNREAEGSIRWNDPDLAIPWNMDQPIVSAKDSVAPFFKDLASPF